MKTKYLQITEVCKIDDSENITIHLIQIEPRYIIYYDGQENPHLSYHWITDEYWASYHRNMRKYYSNGILCEGALKKPESFYLDKGRNVLAEVKQSKIHLKALRPSIVGLELADEKLVAIFVTKISYVEKTSKSAICSLSEESLNTKPSGDADQFSEASRFTRSGSRTRSRGEGDTDKNDSGCRSHEKMRTRCSSRESKTSEKTLSRSNGSSSSCCTLKNQAMHFPDLSPLPESPSSQSEVNKIDDGRASHLKKTSTSVSTHNNNGGAGAVSDSKKSSRENSQGQQEDICQVKTWSPRLPASKRTDSGNSKTEEGHLNECNSKNNDSTSSVSDGEYLDAYIGKSQSRSEKEEISDNSDDNEKSEISMSPEARKRGAKRLHGKKETPLKIRRSSRSPVKPQRFGEQIEINRHKHKSGLSRRKATSVTSKKGIIANARGQANHKTESHGPQEKEDFQKTKNLAILDALLCGYEGKPPEKVEFITLKNLDVSEILKSFSKYQAMLDCLFLKYKDVLHIKGHEGNNHYKVIDLIDNDVQLTLMQRLSERYEATGEGTAKFGKLFAHVMMPEWLLSLYMERLNMNRQDALKRLDAQNMYQAQTTELPFESSLEDCDLDD